MKKFLVLSAVVISSALFGLSSTAEAGHYPSGRSYGYGVRNQSCGVPYSNRFYGNRYDRHYSVFGNRASRYGFSRFNTQQYNHHHHGHSGYSGSGIQIRRRGFSFGLRF